MISSIFQKIKYELQFNNTSYYTRISDKLFKKYYQWQLRKTVLSLPPIKLKPDNAKLTLAILANKKNFFESVAALYSFCYWENNLHIHYHEDGTLAKEDIELLKNIFPAIKVFTRTEQNVSIEKYLTAGGFSNCAQLRGHFIFSIRLFDMIIEKKTPYLLQIDSDVLFFSKPYEILDIIKRAELNGCYNKDRINAYSFDKETIAKYVNAPMVSQFNAGVFMHNFNEAFFSFIENVLEREPSSVNSWHLEQTLFAMYASQTGKFKELPQYYDLAKKERSLGKLIVSEHYVHNTGYDLHKDFIYKIHPSFDNKN